MRNMKTVIIWGHWACGKSTTIEELLALWGEESVDFQTDRLEFVECVIEDVERAHAQGNLEIIEVKEKEGGDKDEAKIKHIGLRGKYATLLLKPEQAPPEEGVEAFLEKIKEDQEFKQKVEFWLHDNTVGLEARRRLAREIIKGRSDPSGEFRLMEMAVSAFTEPDKEHDDSMWHANPFKQTLEYNLQILEDEGVNLEEDVILVYVDAGYEMRKLRNDLRDDPVDEGVFATIGRDGGSLTDEFRHELKERGMPVFKIENNHRHERLFRRELIDLVEDEIRPILEGGPRVQEGGRLFWPVPGGGPERVR